MRIEFDPRKDAVNREKLGISLAAATQLTIEEAFVVTDERRVYGEVRLMA